MTQTNKLIWTKVETGTPTWFSQTGGYRVRREGGYYNLYMGDAKLNSQRTTKTKCMELAEELNAKAAGNGAISPDGTKMAEESLAERQAERELGVPAATFKPFLTEAENAEIDQALNMGTSQQDIDAYDAGPACAGLDAEIKETVAGIAIGQNGQAIAAGCVCRCDDGEVGTCPRHGRKPERIGGPNNTLAAMTERDTAGMEEMIDPDSVPSYMGAAESRKKKAAPLTIDINGETYPMIRGTSAAGKDTVGLTNPAGDAYGLTLDGKNSKCSCPSFEHRSWCKHLVALVGERNAVFGVDAKEEKIPDANDLRNAPLPPRTMPAAESKKRPVKVSIKGGLILVEPEPAGKPLIEVLADDSEDIVRDEEPKGRGGRKGKRSNTETPADSTPAIIPPTIAQDASTTESGSKSQVPAPDVVQASQDALPGLYPADVLAKLSGRKLERIFTAALEGLKPGTTFRQGRHLGVLLDVNAGDAKVLVKERDGSEPAKSTHWAPSTMVDVVKDGGKEEKIVESDKPTDAQSVTIRGGVVTENEIQSNGGSTMKVQRAEYELVLSELGMPAAKLAKMSLKDMAGKLAKLPDRASGKAIKDEAAAKTLKSLLKALEDGEEVEIVGAEKPAKAPKAAKEKPAKKGKEGKAPKASANGSNGHAGNGKAPKVKKEKAPRARGDNAMSLLDAAEKVLGGTKKPLTTREIVEAAEKKGYWKPGAGLTPWDTLKAQLYVDVKKKGKQSRFKFVGKGIFELQS